MYAPDSPVKVYDRDVWLSDAWDAIDYGRDIDWSKPFLAQIYELMLEVPQKSNNIINGTAPSLPPRPSEVPLPQWVQAQGGAVEAATAAAAALYR